VHSPDRPATGSLRLKDIAKNADSLLRTRYER
jgi:hypothetical protein